VNLLLLRLADNGVPEHDLDLPVGRRTGDRFEARLLRRGGIAAGHVVFEPSHQHQQPNDGDGPRHENAQEQ
jgi:hypothetical protein